MCAFRYTYVQSSVSDGVKKSLCVFVCVGTRIQCHAHSSVHEHVFKRKSCVFVWMKFPILDFLSDVKMLLFSGSHLENKRERESEREKEYVCACTHACAGAHIHVHSRVDKIIRILML